ncbi:MAG: nucleotide exchange factor GrpE [Candidatus Omnitrophota bacterium]
MKREEKKQKEVKNASEDPAHAEEIKLSRSEFEVLTEKAKISEDYHDKMLRAYAELDNTKKRLQKEKEEFIKFANEDFILRLLPIVDNFDRAMVSVKHTEETDAVLSGIKLVQRELHNIFKDHGVEVIECVGGKFDPHLHEAITVVESDEHPDDTVIEEVQRGYTMNGRLIRPSIVKVSKKKEDKTKQAEDSDS